jgi:hypothetical protein
MTFANSIAALSERFNTIDPEQHQQKCRQKKEEKKNNNK